MVTQSTANHFDVVNSVTCRVETPNASGTGIFLSIPDSDKRYFVTAKHCLLGKNFDGTLQNEDVTLFAPSPEKDRFFMITLDRNSQIYLSSDLDIALIVMEAHENLNIASIPLLDVRWFQQKCYFRGYPRADESQIGVNIFVNFVDNNVVATLTPLETYDTVSHDNCDGFSGSGVFSIIKDHPYFVGLLYELKEPFSRFNIYNLSQINSVLAEHNLPLLSATELPLSTDLQQSIHQLERKSELVLETIKDKFDEQLNLPRSSVQSRFDDVFRSSRLVILKGIAGAGKSAFAKNQVNTLQKNGYKVLVFKADWFAKESIEDIFPKFNHDLQDLLSALGTAHQLIILIDSLEKLLEVDTYFALKEFMQICKKLPYVRLIITCRDYAYQQLTFDLHYDFPSYSFVEVPLFSDDELAIVQDHFLELESLLDNAQFRKILRRPFYLNIAIRNCEAFQTDKSITELKFRELIWLHVVEKHSQARATIFERIAIERATQMSLFVRLSGLDSTPVQELIHDGILEADERIGDSFRPSHDIYEDIALIRFTERAFQEKQNTEDFFTRIGSKTPAKRRGFRLWLNDTLTEPKRITGFVHDIFESQTIARFWVDEVIIAILRAEYCQNFFEQSKQLLLENDQALLLRFIHLLRTTGQEPDERLIQAVQAQNGKSSYQWIYLKPVGKGWKVITEFINEHFDKLKLHRPLILRLLSEDWSKKIQIDSNLPIESKAVGLMLLKIIDDEKEQYGSWKNKLYSKELIDKGVEVLFRLSKKYEKEVRKLIENANVAKKRSYEKYRGRARQYEERMLRRISGELNDEEEKEEQESYELRSFNETVVKFVLSGLNNQAVCLNMPDLVSKVAKDQWLTNEIETNVDHYLYTLDIGVEFGLLADRDYFPSGIYNTPVRFLLYYHPAHALKLIVDVLNHCTEAYANSSRGRESNIVEVEISHEDGSSTVQKGNAVLWGIFRGTIEATPDLLQSILMSLEAWLLELCQSDEDWANEWIRISYTYLLKNSTSVAVTAVLASVTQAYPHRINKLCFPLLKVREFFRWDIQRLVGESMVLAPYDMKIPFAQEERHKSNQLPHRKFHLEYLVTKLQIEGYYEEISAMIDYLVEKCDDNDTEWKLALNRMDARRFVIDETIETPEENQIALRPVLDEELQDFVEEHAKDTEIQNRAMGVTNWARSLYDGKSEIDRSFRKWQEVFETHQEIAKFEDKLLFHDPTPLAASGIKYFKDDLSLAQMEWCIKIIVETIMQRVVGNIHRAPYSSMHIKPAIEIIPEVLNLNIEDETKQDVKQVIFFALLHLVTNESEYPFEAFRNSMWQIDTNFADACVAGLIQYARLLKTRKWFPPESTEAQNERQKLLRQEEALAKQVAANEISIDITDVSLDTHSGHYLNFAIQIISFNTKNDDYLNFLRQLFYLHLEWNNYDRQMQRRSERYRPNELDYSLQHDLRKYIAQFLLLQNQQVANAFFTDILESIFAPPNKISYESVKYVADILEWIIVKQDTLNTESFWGLWEILEGQIRKSDKKRYVSYLLLSHQWWTSEADSWKPLQKKSLVMRQLVTEFGQYDLKATMQLLSGIGMEDLMPHGLNWLRIVLESVENPMGELADSNVFIYSEKLIRRTYYKYLGEIKRDRQLQQSLLFLLDLLVDVGSSLAFIVRERLITV